MLVLDAGYIHARILVKEQYRPEDDTEVFNRHPKQNTCERALLEHKQRLTQANPPGVGYVSHLLEVKSPSKVKKHKQHTNGEIHQQMLIL